MRKFDKAQPVWVCGPCGVLYGMRKLGVSTWHPDVCGVCSKNVPVTEARDFGYLREGWRAHKDKRQRWR
jgi:hypothetical protein